MKRWLLRIVPMFLILLFIGAALTLPGTATTDHIVIRSEDGSATLVETSSLRSFYRRDAAEAPDQVQDPVPLTITHHLKSGVERTDAYVLDRGSGLLLEGNEAFVLPEVMISSAFDFLYDQPELEPVQLTTGDQIHTLPTTRGSLEYRAAADHWLSIDLVTEIVDEQFDLSSEKAPTLRSDATSGALWVDDRLVPWSVGEALPLPAEEGTYRVKLQLQYDLGTLRGSRESHFDVRVNHPATFTLEKHTLERGEMITLEVNHLDEDETPYLEVPFGSSRFYGEGSTRVARFAASYHDTPGTYTLRYGIENGVHHEEEITLEPGTFEIQHLWIDPNVEASTRNDAAYNEYNMYFPPARSVSDARDLAQGHFVLPVKGRLSTSFGETRYVNGSPTSYRHSGIDIAAPTGTPVGALARGRITLSRHFILTGNTVVIDHGRGLFSVYFHLHTLDAADGDLVAAGDQIGTVGTTGFSTGPHLHLTTSYFDRNIAPGRLLYGEVLTYDNYKERFDTTNEGPANES